MRTTALSLANVRGLARRFVGLALMVALATAAVVAAAGVSGQASGAADERLQEGAVNRSVVVDRLGDEDAVGGTALTAAAISRLEAIPEVTSVEPALRATFGYKDRTIPGALMYANVLRATAPPPIVRSTRPVVLPLREDEIILPGSVEGMDLSSLLGKRINVEITRGTGQGHGVGTTAAVTVVALSDARWEVDGPSAAYGTEGLVTTWAAERVGVSSAVFRQSVGYDRLTVVATSSSAVPRVLTAVQDSGFSAYSRQQELAALPGVLGLIHYATWALMLCLGLVGFLGALTLTGALGRERTREVGILRAVGYRRRDVLRMLLTETGLVACAATGLGLVIGLLLQAGALQALRRSATLRPYLSDRPALSVTMLVLVTTFGVLVCLLGSLVPAWRSSRLAPGDAVKDW